MALLTKLIDHLWNLKFLTGYRTKVAQVVLGVVAGYQGVATSKELIAAGVDLPDIPTAIFVPLVAYFSAKVAQFAREHR